MLVVIDKFDNSQEEIMKVGVCPECKRETLLVDGTCSLCWEKKLGIELVDGEVEWKETNLQDC